MISMSLNLLKVIAIVQCVGSKKGFQTSCQKGETSHGVTCFDNVPDSRNLQNEVVTLSSTEEAWIYREIRIPRQKNTC